MIEKDCIILFFFLGNHVYACDVLGKLKAFLPLKYENMQVFEYICKGLYEIFVKHYTLLFPLINKKLIPQRQFMAHW